MENYSEGILSNWEAQAYIENLQTIPLEEIGTKSWFEFHKKLMLLNQQSVFEINTMREESIKEWFISFQKIPILILEAIQISIWKQKVFPLLIELNEEPTNTFLLYSVFYHEDIVISLLVNVLYYAESAETMNDSVLDLIDYAVNNVTALLYVKQESSENQQNFNSCLEELMEKKCEFELDIRLKCISILRYLAEFSEYLPVSAISRMLCTHDVPYFLSQLLEVQPWKKKVDGEIYVYEGKWEKVNENEENKLCKIEGQVWLGLRELLLNPKCAPYYEITEFRMFQFLKLQKYMYENVIDQIAPLMDLRRWLSLLNVSPTPSNAQQPIYVEVVPQIRLSIMDKYNKRWKKLAKYQSKFLFTKDINHIKSMAQILNDAYDIDKLDTVQGHTCLFCKEIAQKRCSQCKIAWYCGRECQVKDWANHKDICTKIQMSNFEKTGQ